MAKKLKLEEEEKKSQGAGTLEDQVRQMAGGNAANLGVTGNKVTPTGTKTTGTTGTRATPGILANPPANQATQQTVNGSGVTGTANTQKDEWQPSISRAVGNQALTVISQDANKLVNGTGTSLNPYETDKLRELIEHYPAIIDPQGDAPGAAAEGKKGSGGGGGGGGSAASSNGLFTREQLLNMLTDAMNASVQRQTSPLELLGQQQLANLTQQPVYSQSDAVTNAQQQLALIRQQQPGAFQASQAAGAMLQETQRRAPTFEGSPEAQAMQQKADAYNAKANVPYTQSQQVLNAYTAMQNANGQKPVYTDRSVMPEYSEDPETARVRAMLDLTGERAPQFAESDRTGAAYAALQGLQGPGEFTESDRTQNYFNRLDNYQMPGAYQEGADVIAARERLDAIENERPGAYQSSYQERIDRLLDQITNPSDEFSYNAEEDPLYQSYRDMYIRLGQRAMEDTAGRLAGMTGGMASSFAGSAGQQAYQDYLTRLNEQLPSFYDRAYQRYRDDRNDPYNQLGALNSAEDAAYGRYRDTVGDFLNERNYLNQNYQTEAERDYGRHRDAVADALNERSFLSQQAQQGEANDLTKYENARSQYNTDRSAAMSLYDMMYGQDYNLYQNALNQYNQNQNRAQNQYNTDRDFGYGQYRDQLSQYNTDRAFNYGRYQDALSQYNADRANAQDMYNLLYNQEYGRYRDRSGDLRSDRDYFANRGDTLYDRARNEYLTDLGQYNENRDFARDMYNTLYNQEYGRYADALDQYNTDRAFAAQQAQQQYANDYGQYQDRLSQYNQDRNAALDLYGTEARLNEGRYETDLGQYNANRNFILNLLPYMQEEIPAGGGGGSAAPAEKKESGGTAGSGAGTAARAAAGGGSQAAAQQEAAQALQAMTPDELLKLYRELGLG